MANPSLQDIQDYLHGLNRTVNTWSPSTESEAAKQKGVDNYLHWFKQHKIAIYKDTKGAWKLVQETKHG